MIVPPALLTLAAAAQIQPLGHSAGMLASSPPLLEQLRDPWTWFGFGANGLFFMRFFWQWIVSEKRKRSTVPVAFWYLSLGGAACMFIYGLHLRNLVVMLGGFLPCIIYIRNLMLIYSHGNQGQPPI